METHNEKMCDIVEAARLENQSLLTRARTAQHEFQRQAVCFPFTVYSSSQRITHPYVFHSSDVDVVVCTFTFDNKKIIRYSTNKLLFKSLQ